MKGGCRDAGEGNITPSDSPVRVVRRGRLSPRARQQRSGSPGTRVRTGILGAVPTADSGTPGANQRVTAAYGPSPGRRQCGQQRARQFARRGAGGAWGAGHRLRPARGGPRLRLHGDRGPLPAGAPAQRPGRRGRAPRRLRGGRRGPRPRAARRLPHRLRPERADRAPGADLAHPPVRRGRPPPDPAPAGAKSRTGGRRCPRPLLRPGGPGAGPRGPGRAARPGRRPRTALGRHPARRQGAGRTGGGRAAVADGRRQPRAAPRLLHPAGRRPYLARARPRTPARHRGGGARPGRPATAHPGRGVARTADRLPGRCR
ncbi:hypothetical protein SCYAM73S_03275 [Streptomyces cyaneofuscatus]